LALFKSKEERRVERDIKIRQGIRRIERAIAEQNKFSDEFVKNAREAKRIGDTNSYVFIRNSLKKTAAIKRMLERQLLAVKNALLIKRQAEATADFSNAMGMMAREVSRLYGDTDLVKTQSEWEKAMAQSQTMEERMSLFLDGVEEAAQADVTVTAEPVSDEEIDQMIVAEEAAEGAEESSQMAELRAELSKLKGEGAKEQR
jgi:hypothetical protein